MDRLPQGDLQRGDLPADLRGHRRRRRGRQERPSDGSEQRHRRGLGRHARPRPQEPERADERKGIPRHAAARPGLRGIPLRHGEGLRTGVHEDVQRVGTAPVLRGRVLGQLEHHPPLDRRHGQDLGRLRLPVPLHRAQRHQQGRLEPAGQAERRQLAAGEQGLREGRLPPVGP